MENPVAPTEGLKIEQLLQLHNLTKDVSKLFQKHLRSCLETVALLFRPRRIFGDAMEGIERESIGGSERSIAELRELYRRVAVRPFDLRPELDLPIESISTQLQLYEWEYNYQTTDDRRARTIKVTAPLTWVVAYSSTYSLSMLRQVLAGSEDRDPEAVRAFVLRACLMYFQFTKFPAIADLLGGLRYRVEVRRSDEMGELPLVTISAPVGTMRPLDNLLNLASGLAGGTSFAEVLDVASLRTLKDPIREQIAVILHSHGQEF